METAATNNILAHSGLSLYPNPISTSVQGLLSSSPTQESTSSRLSGNNSWGSYSGESGLVPHNSCSMASYSNLPLGASFPMNSKAYNAFGGSTSDYLNCRQMVNHMSPLNAMPMRNYSSPYIDMYQSHTAGYPNGGFYPDMTSGIPPFAGRDLECRPPPSDSAEGGNYVRINIFLSLTVYYYNTRKDNIFNFNFGMEIMTSFFPEGIRKQNYCYY